MNEPNSQSHRGYVLATWALILGVLLLRIIYQWQLNPYELAGDEAHYWDWSRHPALSYYSKGPGVAMSILASCKVFGQTEFGVRLPAALYGALLMWAMARLSVRLAGGDRRAGFFGATLGVICPPLAAVSGFMTIDTPFLAFWTLSVWAGWSAFEANHRGKAALGSWVALALAMGIGFLFKYTIILLAPAFIIFMILRGRWLGGFRRWPIGLVLCLVVFLAAVSPVLIWNQHNDWPTIKHTLGQVAAAGGDVKRDSPKPYDPMWTLEYVGGQIGIVGPPLLLLIGVASALRFRRREEHPAQWTATVYLLAIGVFVLIFFGAVTYRTDVEANWPMPAFVPLLVIAAGVLPDEIARYKKKLADWLALPQNQRAKEGFFRAKPETKMQVFWHWSLAWGICAAIGIAFAPLVRHVPGVPPRIFKRIIGHEARAAQVYRVLQQIENETGHTPLIIDEHYMRSSLLAFYMPGQPKVYCAASLLGSRRNAFDYFDDTNLFDPGLIGRDAVMVDGYAVNFQRIFTFDRWNLQHEENDIFVGYQFAGVIGHDDKPVIDEPAP